MRTIFSIGISESATTFPIGLVRQHAAIRRSLGSGWCCLATIVVTLGANASIAAFPDTSSFPLGITAVLFLGFACCASCSDDVLGGPDKWQRVAWFVYGAMLAWCFVVDVSVGSGVFADRWITYGAAFAIWIGVGLIAGGSMLSPVSFAYSSSVLLALMTLPAVAIDSFWTSCSQRFDKCSPAGELFRSFASSENYIAIVAAFTFVACLTALRGTLRVLALMNAAIVIVATGSRTGMVALATAVAVIALLNVCRYRLKPLVQISSPVSIAGSAMAGGLAAYLIFTADPETLSKRGTIWLAVRTHIDGNLIGGVGVSKWSYLQGVGESPQHFFHSGYALVIFSGGIVAMILLCVWFSLLLRRARGAEVVIVIVPLVVLLMVYSLTEVIWNPLAVDGLTWLSVLLSCIRGNTASVQPAKVVPLAPAV